MLEESSCGPAVVESGTAGIERDPQFWLRDGNIVIVAQCTAFRVHESVLSLHSNVFRDLFLMPQPLEVNEDDAAFEGTHVVRVSDTSCDLREFLRAIYGQTKWVLQDIDSRCNV